MPTFSSSAPNAATAPAETCTVYYTADGGPLAPVGAVPPAEDIHEGYDEETIAEIRDQLGF